MVSHRITKIRCTMCSTEVEEKFSRKKDWPNDPNYKVNYLIYSNMQIMIKVKFVIIMKNKKF